VSKRLCLLTGASGTFGTAFIERLAERYDIVAVHYRHEVMFASQDQIFIDPLDPSIPIGANRHPVRTIRADLANVAAIDRLVEEAGGGPVDLLVNAAAIRSSSPLLAYDALQHAETTIGVNVLAPLRLSVRLAQTQWRQCPDANVQSNRNIVNILSTTGLAVYEDHGLAVHAASMAALNHLTCHLASEFWDIGLRVNAIALDPFPDRATIDEAVDAAADLDVSARTGHVATFYRRARPPGGPQPSPS